MPPKAALSHGESSWLWAAISSGSRYFCSSSARMTFDADDPTHRAPPRHAGRLKFPVPKDEEIAGRLGRGHGAARRAMAWASALLPLPGPPVTRSGRRRYNAALTNSGSAEHRGHEREPEVPFPLPFLLRTGNPSDTTQDRPRGITRAGHTPNRLVDSGSNWLLT